MKNTRAIKKLFMK